MYLKKFFLQARYSIGIFFSLSSNAEFYNFAQVLLLNWNVNPMLHCVVGRINIWKKLYFKISDHWKKFLEPGIYESVDDRILS